MIFHLYGVEDSYICESGIVESGMVYGSTRLEFDGVALDSSVSTRIDCSHCGFFLYSLRVCSQIRYNPVQSLA